MEYDEDKIAEMVLALLRLNLDTEGRVWKGFPWDTMERLHDKGMMGNPVGKAPQLTERGEAR